jgi:hypothetical protein
VLIFLAISEDVLGVIFKAALGKWFLLLIEESADAIDVRDLPSHNFVAVCSTLFFKPLRKLLTCFSLLSNCNFMPSRH